MRGALSAFCRAHQIGHLIVVTIGCGLVAVTISSMPVPQVELSLREYTKAVGFFLGPLLVVPVLAVGLRGAEPYERQAARLLVWQRVLLATSTSSFCFVMLMPSALVAPVADAGRVLLENSLWVLGLALVLSRLLPPVWVFLPIYAVALVGVTGPEGNLIALLLPVDRAAQALDLGGGAALYLTGVVVFGLTGRRDPDSRVFKNAIR